MAPPDGGTQLEAPLPYGRDDLPERGDARVVEQRGEGIVADAPGEQRGVIALEQRALEATAALAIPVQAHHVREIVATRVHAPAVPVEEPDGVLRRIARMERVPHVRVAVDEG